MFFFPALAALVMQTTGSVVIVVISVIKSVAIFPHGMDLVTILVATDLISGQVILDFVALAVEVAFVVSVDATTFFWILCLGICFQ